MKEKDGRPMAGVGTCLLGVRLSSEGKAGDVRIDSEGNVGPESGGMSVAPSLETLLSYPPTFLPRRLEKLSERAELPVKLRSLFKRARGSNTLRLWEMGSGGFRDGVFATDLLLVIDSPKHGVISAARSMSTESYLEALADTGSDWRSAEPS
jgi:hypothetical protein